MADDLPTAGEPDSGWVTSPTLVDTELLVTTLCRFTGTPVSHDVACGARSQHRHLDVECRTLYFQAGALVAGVSQLEGFERIPEEVRQPWAGGNLTGVTHA